MSKVRKFAGAALAMIAAAALFVVNPQQAKAQDINIVQTSATTTSATFQWSPIAGADYYHLECNGSTLDTKATSATVNASHAGYYGEEMTVWITAYKIDSSYTAGKRSLAYDYAYVASKPVAVPDLTAWQTGTGNPSLKLAYASYHIPDGFNVQILDTKGKVIVNTTTASSYYTFTSNKVKNKGFSVRIQPFYTNKVTADGKVYGDWSTYQSYVPQPKVNGTSKRYYYSRTKNISLKWKKIAGAKGYTIYRSTSRDGKYKKIGTTKSTSFSQGVGYSSSYYYKVVANKVPVKAGGKTKKLNSYTKNFFYYVYAY